MWANRIALVVVSVLAIFMIPVQLVTTLVLGILVTMTFGLLLIPLSFVWTVLFLAPLLGLSWLWRKVPFLRILLGCVDIPIPVIGDIYVSLIPTAKGVRS